MIRIDLGAEGSRSRIKNLISSNLDTMFPSSIFKVMLCFLYSNHALRNMKDVILCNNLSLSF